MLMLLRLVRWISDASRGRLLQYTAAVLEVGAAAATPG
jgi:hypothetical protein